MAHRQSHTPPAELTERAREREELGRLLKRARTEYRRSGKPFLDWEGIAAEVAERRGGAERA